MFLAVDIGNTNTVIGLFGAGYDIKTHWRISTSKIRTADEYGIIFSSLFGLSGFRASRVKGAALVSVVPQATEAAVSALRKYFNIEPVVAGAKGVKLGIVNRADKPEEVGTDRLVNAAAARKLYKKPAIVVDFGTAITFDYVNNKGEFLGGAIAPGISICSEALFERTAKLPLIDIKEPRRAIGRNTVESMRSGLFWGFCGLVDAIIAKMLEEAEKGTIVIATGGQAHVFSKSCPVIGKTDEFLTLKGLRTVYEGNRV